MVPYGTMIDEGSMGKRYSHRMRKVHLLLAGIGDPPPPPNHGPADTPIDDIRFFADRGWDLIVGLRHLPMDCVPVIRIVASWLRPINEGCSNYYLTSSSQCADALARHDRELSDSIGR